MNVTFSDSDKVKTIIRSMDDEGGRAICADNILD